MVDKDEYGFTFLISGKIFGSNPELNCEFNPVIDLKGDFEICLLSLHTYNCIPNVTKENNVFRCNMSRGNNKDTWMDVEIPIGTYDIDDLEQAIEKQIQQLGGDDVGIM
ncbi:hypothetical protein QE152_g27333 [Popillia japonica]|uniref:Uncharacterized protein n=1 Tax=Popillia japonica TaxID=7064 RepID=A0AAW1JUQ0_POPJA